MSQRKVVWCGKDDNHEPHTHKEGWCVGVVPLVTWKDWMGGG